ncbi:MAG: FtsX-like permease family protein [Nitrospirota bacterium]|nr:FtsX-like permease family protein [Nitrospirota bacterium]
MNAWFRYFLTRSISQRRGRFILSSSAVLLSVMVVTALVTVSLGVREKIGAELKRYGANMIVTHGEGQLIPGAVAQEVRGLSPAIKDAASQLYGSAMLRQTAVEIVGIEPGKMAGYRVAGSLPAGPSELMVGVNLREAIKVKQGGTIAFDGHSGEFTISAFFEKGPDDDSTIVLTLAGAQKLLAMDGVSAVLLNADSARLLEVERRVRERWPFLEVKTLKQVAVAEERILGRIQLLMLLVTVVVLFSSMVALGSTMGANVIERMEEIGLMKAIGATRGDIRSFFMAEAALAGLTGSLAGYGGGVLAAEAVSRTAFGSFVPLNVLVIPGALVLGMVIAIAATYIPVRGAMKVVPARILRGE